MTGNPEVVLGRSDGLGEVAVGSSRSLRKPTALQPDGTLGTGESRQPNTTVGAGECHGADDTLGKNGDQQANDGKK